MGWLDTVETAAGAFSKGQATYIQFQERKRRLKDRAKAARRTIRTVRRGLKDQTNINEPLKTQQREVKTPSLVSPRGPRPPAITGARQPFAFGAAAVVFLLFGLLLIARK